MRVPYKQFARGEYFHLFNHAAGDRLLFADEEDYRRFLTTLKRYCGPDSFSVIAYCLLPSHFHLLIRQETDTPAFTSFYAVSASYSRYFNKKHGSWGSIFRGKLQHRWIKNSRQLIQTCVYIHRNPQEAGLVECLEDWQWSNYLEWADVRDGVLFDPEVRKMFFSSAQAYVDCLREYKPRKTSFPDFA